MEKAGACGKDGRRQDSKEDAVWLVVSAKTCHGTKMRWRNRVKKDLKKFGRRKAGTR